MRILFGTNVLPDFFLKRLPHFPAAQALFHFVETGWIAGFVAAHTLPTLAYRTNWSG